MSSTMIEVACVSAAVSKKDAQVFCFLHFDHFPSFRALAGGVVDMLAMQAEHWDGNTRLHGAQAVEIETITIILHMYYEYLGSDDRRV